MDIKENFPLKQYNTFGIDAFARYFVELSTNEEIASFLALPFHKNTPLLVLGGGSNIIFTKDFEGTIIKIESKGIHIAEETSDDIFIKAQAGELWDDLVQFCVDRNFAGMENLSLIPGSVGASPIQNIGAYGVEVKDVFYELDAIDINTGVIKTFKKEDCFFSYRDSVFKNQLKGQFIILSVTFKLSKTATFHTQYGAIKEELEKMNCNDVNVKAIRQAVITIRKEKLPEPKEIGNAGSFFKNPIVEQKQFLSFKKKYPNIVAFEQPNKTYKLAAGWLIEQCGWKGKRLGQAGVHEKQALVLINLGKATGNDVLELSSKIEQSILKTFGIQLEKEVNIV